MPDDPPPPSPENLRRTARGCREMAEVALVYAAEYERRAQEYERAQIRNKRPNQREKGKINPKTTVSK